MTEIALARHLMTMPASDFLKQTIKFEGWQRSIVPFAID